MLLVSLGGSNPILDTHWEGAKIAFLTLYVDDILLAEHELAFLPEIKNWLFHTFEMKDLGYASYILNIKITRDKSSKETQLVAGDRYCYSFI